MRGTLQLVTINTRLNVLQHQQKEKRPQLATKDD